MDRVSWDTPSTELQDLIHKAMQRQEERDQFVIKKILTGTRVTGILFCAFMIILGKLDWKTLGVVSEAAKGELIRDCVGYLLFFTVIFEGLAFYIRKRDRNNLKRDNVVTSGDYLASYYNSRRGGKAVVTHLIRLKNGKMVQIRMGDTSGLKQRKEISIPLFGVKYDMRHNKFPPYGNVIVFADAVTKRPWYFFVMPSQNKC